MDGYFWPVLAAWLWFFATWTLAGCPTSIRTLLKRPANVDRAIQTIVGLAIWPVTVPLYFAVSVLRGIYINVQRLLHSTSS